MSANRFTFDGLEALRQALQDLPARLVGDATHRIEAAANGATVRVRTVYGQHRHTGNLQDHVVVTHRHSAFGAKSVVRSTARHAHLFEYGRQLRYKGMRGGAQRPRPTFVPIMEADRRKMYEDLKALLEREGLQVTGDA